MRISYSKYKAFVDNPERYRLYYALGLTPEGDETPNRMNLGRRRGRCFHAMYENTPRPELVKEYGEELVARCELMRTAVPDLGKLELVETSFDIPIGDGKHSINGRRDHVFFLDGEWRCGDFKSTKGTRTKKELTSYINELETSPQSHFYLRSLRGTGFDTDLFRYHVVLDRKDPKHLPTYIPIDLHVGQAEVDRTMAEVYAACETIQFLTNTYGVERPWCHSNNWPCCGDKFFCGYQGICGRTIPKGAEPAGFTYRWRDEIQKADA